jgi:XTP/dITP diphosphohydrolase
MQDRLLVGTRNEGKVREIKELLSDLPLYLSDLSDFPHLAEVEETAATYLDNAILKAVGYAQATKLWTIAEDSGLEVVALNGAPGVFSARHAGEHASTSDRNMKVLSEVRENGDIDRSARFICVSAVASSDGQVLHSAEGVCYGTIAPDPRGSNGFGYDSIFIPDGFSETFGELPTAIKQEISHRARAFHQMSQFLVHLFRSHAE